MTYIIWLAVGGVALLVELWTADLLFASIGLSAVVASLVALGGAGDVWAALSFGASIVLTLVLLRPIGLRALRRGGDFRGTNVDALIGIETEALTDITKSSGQVKLRGEIWSATTHDSTITAGTSVLVIRIDGATAVVTRKEGQ